MIVLPCLAFSATLNVKQDGTGDYTVIQTAIDAANPGDTVLVYPGRYFESLMIQTNNISLSSLEATAGNQAYVDSTIVDGTGSIGGIIVGQFKTDINIRGFSVTNGMSPGIAMGQSSETSVTNCKIFGRASTIGRGINIGGATVTLSGVQIFDNYAMQLGGGIYADSGGGYVNNITFDPVNRCSLYNNRAGSGQDIYIQNATSDLDIHLDTFTVAEPSSYYATYISASPNNFNTYQINFDIQNAHHQEIDSDVYVSTTGSDDNDGLSHTTALKTIHEAIYRVASDSLNQKTVHILPGVYSRTDNDQVFPIAMKSWVIVQGSGIDTTTVILEPHPSIPLSYGYWDIVFKATRVYNTTIAGMTFLSRNTDDSGLLLGNKLSTINLKDIHISEFYPDYAAVIRLSSSSERKTIWENVTIEDIIVPNRGLVNIDLPIFGSISNSTFRNSVSTYVSSSVGAHSLIGIVGDKSLEFDNCEFSNLTMYDDDSIAITVIGSQFPQQQDHFSFKNCLFSNNNSQGGVMNVASYNNPRIDITNCTFAGNLGDAYTLMVNGDANITNSIFWNDTPYQIKVNDMYGNPNEHTHLTIDHSLVKDGIAGIMPYPIPGNTIDFLASSINADPLFAGGLDIHDPEFYSLSEFSPCIDSGTEHTDELALPPYDLAGNWRVWNNRIDMGAFEYGSEPWVTIDDPVLPPIPETNLTTYPNPFSAFTNIKVSALNGSAIKHASVHSASITIYNVKGQKVKSIELDPHKAGEQITAWDGRDAEGVLCSSGVYIVNLMVNGRKLSGKKVTLIR
jgi:hypothetical protein